MIQSNGGKRSNSSIKAGRIAAVVAFACGSLFGKVAGSSALTWFFYRIFAGFSRGFPDGRVPILSQARDTAKQTGRTGILRTELTEQCDFFPDVLVSIGSESS